MALADYVPRILDVPSQSLLLRGARVWFPRTSIASRIARDVGCVPLATLAKGCKASHEEIRTTQYFVVSDKEHVVCCKKAEEGGKIFRVPPLLCSSLRIDALQATRWVRATGIFLLVSFVLGIRAASASQAHLTRIPVVERTWSLKSSDAEAKISSEVDAALGDGAKTVNNLSHGDQECGKANNVQLTNQRTNFEHDQDHTLHHYNIVAYDGINDGASKNLEDIVAYDGCNDSSYKEFAEDFFEGETMQQAPVVSLKPQMQTTVNQSSSATGAAREQQETHVEDKILEKGFQELSSTSYKLMVPLRVVGLRGSVPPIWLKDFMLSQGKRVKIKFESKGGLEEIMSALDSALKKKQVTPRSILAADVVTLGDSWLHAAVSKRLIQPIENAEQHEWFNRLGPKWQAFLRRDVDGRLEPKGLIWGAPYRWGSMVIAFRTDKLSRNKIAGIEDWQDLWCPELTGKIAMVDSSREVVGAVLKSLGASYNTQDFDTEVEGGRLAVKQQLLALQKQVKVFDSVHYLKALQSDDVWVAVGWSNDVIPVAKRMSNVRVIAPKSGASLWADLWAVPAASSIPSNKIGSRVFGASPLVHQWFDFCLQPARAEPFKQGVFVGASPLQVFEEDSKAVDGKQRLMDDISGRATGGIHSAADRRSGPAMDTNMIDGMPPEDSLEKSEVLEPLSEKALADYRWLFSQVAEQGHFREKMLEILKQLFKGGIKQN